jgi:hypothetical protein
MRALVGRDNASGAEFKHYEKGGIIEHKPVGRHRLRISHIEQQFFVGRYSLLLLAWEKSTDPLPLAIEH